MTSKSIVIARGINTPPSRAARPRSAFTLLEVLIAMAVFFTAVFSILELVSQNLRAARALTPESVDIADAISDLILTNRVEECTESGDFGDWARGYAWTRTLTEVGTNGLFRVDVTVIRSDPPLEKTTSLLLYKPDSKRRPGGSYGRGGLRSVGEP